MQKRWKDLVEGRTEIDVLVSADLTELKAEPKIIHAIEAFRSGKVRVMPGGGGKYGEILLPESLMDNSTKGQRSLLEF